MEWKFDHYQYFQDDAFPVMSLKKISRILQVFLLVRGKKVPGKMVPRKKSPPGGKLRYSASVYNWCSIAAVVTTETWLARTGGVLDISAAPLLRQYCARTPQVLYRYSASTVPVLRQCCAGTTPVLRQCWAVNPPVLRQ